MLLTCDKRNGIFDLKKKQKHYIEHLILLNSKNKNKSIFLSGQKLQNFVKTQLKYQTLLTFLVKSPIKNDVFLVAFTRNHPLVIARILNIKFAVLTDLFTIKMFGLLVFTFLTFKSMYASSNNHVFIRIQELQKTC